MKFKRQLSLQRFATPTLPKSNKYSIFGKSTVGLQQKVGIPLLCVKEFVEYINAKIDKYPNKYRGIERTTPTNVVQNLIQILNRKGFGNLNKDIVKQIHNDLSKSRFPRKKIIEYIRDSVDKDFAPGEHKSSSSLRNYMTFSSKLDAATEQTILYAEPSQKYGKTTKSLESQGKPVTYTPLTPDELEFINGTPYYKNSNHFKTLGQILSGRKTECGNCWICGKEIHIYHFSTTDKNRDLEVTCGQDEHVFPPGWGNLVGTLLPTYKSTVQSFDKTTPKTTLFGLRPSHSWCNQMKKDRILVNPPGFENGIITPENTGFSVNTEEIRRFVRDCRRKLELPSIHGYESYEQWFRPGQSPKDIDTFVKEIETSTTRTLNEFCKTLNEPGMNHDVYTMHLLQIIFNMCWFACTFIFKDKPEFMALWNDNVRIGGSNPKNKRKTKLRKRQKRRNTTIRVKGGNITETDQEIFKQLFPEDMFKDNNSECSVDNTNIITLVDESVVNPDSEPINLFDKEEYELPSAKKTKYSP